MKVRDLIRILQGEDQDATVLISADHSGTTKVVDLSDNICDEDQMEGAYYDVDTYCPDTEADYVDTPVPVVVLWGP